MRQSLTTSTLKEQRETGITAARFIKDDKPTEDLLSIFGMACSLIEGKRAAGVKVLVHCRMGMSRSVTLVMAYRMFESPFSFKAH